MIWPFKRKAVEKVVDSHTIQFSQLDITERFGDNESLGPEDWIATSPLNASIPDPEKSGLPRVGATKDEVSRIASRMSAIRESLPLVKDGVYCPICHIANIDRRRVRTPCPKCGHDLMQFGWD